MINKKPLKRVKIGLNKTDARIIHERLNQLKNELEQEFESVCNRSTYFLVCTMTKTKYQNIERKYRIHLTAVNLLITHLNYEKIANNSENSSFRQTSKTAQKSTNVIANKTGIASGDRFRARPARDNRGSLRRSESELRNSNVGGFFSSPSASY